MTTVSGQITALQLGDPDILALARVRCARCRNPIGTGLYVRVRRFGGERFYHASCFRPVLPRKWAARPGK